MEARAAHWKLQLNACSFVVKVFVLTFDIVGGWKVYYGFESHGMDVRCFSLHFAQRHVMSWV